MSERCPPWMMKLETTCAATTVFVMRKIRLRPNVRRSTLEMLSAQNIQVYDAVFKVGRRAPSAADGKCIPGA
jgi:hypothetical protein